MGDGIYLSDRREAWVYRALPLLPLEWEDPPARLEFQSKLERLLLELGETTKDLGGGLQMLAQGRDVHFVSCLYDVPERISENITPELADFQARVLYAKKADKFSIIGVKLRKDALNTIGSREDLNVFQKLKSLAKTAAKEPENLGLFEKDYQRVSNILARAGARVPTEQELRFLESWFTDGEGLDKVLYASDQRILVKGGPSWQISAFMGVEEYSMSLPSPNSTWLLDAMNHRDGAECVSIRSTLQPATVVRGRLRRSQRILRSQQAEEEATGDISRDELYEKEHMAKSVEEYTRSSGNAWMANTSVLFARRITDEPDETYEDLLTNAYGFKLKTLEKRQLEALSEMMPGSTTRINPFEQDVTPAWVAYSGACGFGKVGENDGLILGATYPNGATAYVDVYGASTGDVSPIMGVFGEPGSGKTFTSQFLCAQAALNDVTTVMINPKGFDSLKPFAAWLAGQGVDSRVVSMQKAEAGQGAFDPFKFVEPKMAAEILTRHIITVLGVTYDGGLTGRQEVTLGKGLVDGADAGARCAMDALEYVQDPDIVDQVKSMVAASTLFALAFSNVPAEPNAKRRGFTLIEFDRELPLPRANKDPKSYERQERIALAALRLVSRTSLELLMNSGGGVLMVDEAHHFLGSDEGMATLDRIAREGRSLGLLPIFATQKITDLLKVDMESFMSRVLVLKLTDPNEVSAALRICGMEVTEERIRMLAAAEKGQGFYKDLWKRHSLIQTAAGVPEELRLAMSTNRADREARAKAEQETARWDETPL